MSDPAATYTPRPDVGPESELNALSSVYSYILRCHEKRDRLPDKSGPDDAKERS